ncbi:MAG: hypothetical protein ACRDP6_44355, partial [Actinoallomurus sp.]
PALTEALTMAGAAPPIAPGTRALLAANARFTVTGHVNGSYSLAAINRDVALAIEAERPGSVRWCRMSAAMSSTERPPGTYASAAACSGVSESRCARASARTCAASAMACV